MKALNLTQGTPEWHAHRSTHRNASDAPAVMTASPYVSRSELIRRRALGIEPEHDAATLARFQRGHDVEPALRALAERLTGEDLYPVVAISDDGYLSASFDGVSMDETLIFEAKQHNAAKFMQMDAQKIPAEDYWQIVHQFAVCETASRCLYLVGDGSDSSARMEILRSQIEHEIPQLLAGWRQFDEDVKNYRAEPAAVVAAAEVQTLPAVSVQVNGAIQIASNLPAFGMALKDFIAGIDMKPETDEAFAHAEAAVKTLAKAQEALEAAKASGLAQVATVDEMVRTVDGLAQLARTTRLTLEKMVKGRKDEIRGEIATKARLAFFDYLAGQNKKFGGRVMLPVNTPDFAGAMKNKRTIQALHDAVADLMAKAKIEVSQLADDYARNLATIDEIAKDHLFLFRDLSDLVTVDPEHLAGIVRGRIAEHQQAEAKREEEQRERIRREEEARAQRDAEARAEQERQRIREEERAKARKEAEERRRVEAAASAARSEAALESMAGQARPMTVAPAAAPVATTKQSPAAAVRPATRPSDVEIVGVLALHYRVHESKVIEWLLELDLDAVTDHMTKEFA